jgi:TolA-binding protein
MRTRFLERIVRASPLLGLVVLAATFGGCGTAEKARREAEMAALVKQVEELRKGQEQIGKDLGKLAGELKALDAQAAFLVGETKAAATEREQLKAGIQQQDGAVRGLRSALDETNQKVATLSVPPPAPAAAPKPAPPPGREATAEKLYATAMASFRADEHGQAVLEFTELIDKFPKHTLAASAQYWIGDRVPEGARSRPPAPSRRGVAAQARHVLSGPARPAARPRDVGAGGEVAPPDRGRHPGARAPRLARWRPPAAVIQPAPVLPQFAAPVY